MNGQYSNKSPRIVIVGAGISGLSCAYRLKKLLPSARITILESSNRTGGLINSIRLEDSLIETGPESFNTLKPEIRSLAMELGLENQIISTNDLHRRSFLNINNRLHPLPEGLMFFAPTKLSSLAGSDIFSIYGKLRMAIEFFLPAAKGSQDESLSSFVRRRLGNETLEKLAEPMIAAIYGGNPDLLSAESTVGQLVEMERKHGSIIRGLLKNLSKHDLKSAGPRYAGLASFKEGIGVLSDKLVQALDRDCLKLGKAVTAISLSENNRDWTVLCSDKSIYRADYLVLGNDASQCAKLLNKVNPRLAELLAQISRSPALIINLLYRRNDIKHALDGLGFVVPARENTFISACSFSSVKYAGRTSKDKVLIRVFSGGVQKAEALSMNENDLLECCHSELKDLLKIEADPIYSHLIKHKNAIPQYLVGHRQLISQIEQEQAKVPGLQLIGNSYSGVGLPDCVRTANAAAKNLQTSIAKGLPA